jgi:hypothetical protein
MHKEENFALLIERRAAHLCLVVCSLLINSFAFKAIERNITFGNGDTCFFAKSLTPKLTGDNAKH